MLMALYLILILAITGVFWGYRLYRYPQRSVDKRFRPYYEEARRSGDEKYRFFLEREREVQITRVRRLGLAVMTVEGLVVLVTLYYLTSVTH